ncbi:pyridoxamine 5'-phosphate oxidase family protein [Streptomyces sp. H27-D2]|uniref:pyridoxamine 5'-phosphate oxidase family protein n=1 Tax=Streptomyces sp. H27-D2 TaxID=3046304 RepID=UPI002DB8E790|nr:pyridoxamine 5'-phosphate oxidase family protein [Streptomyces sp. H27-D2]MEC4017363.1 pyridoxamine 5'-phosphate oxidase family protein [Streptomyces sp. H27-D2]
MANEELRALELFSRTPYGRIAVSMRALPFVTVARHIVVDRKLILRLHSGFGYQQACDGSVVAYGADNIDSGSDDVWSLQCVGTAHRVEPGRRELDLFGSMPRYADDQPFEPAYLRIEPQLVTVHRLQGVSARQCEHSA